MMRVISRIFFFPRIFRSTRYRSLILIVYRLLYARYFFKSRYYNCRYLEFQLLLDSSRYSILGVYFYTFVFNIRYFDVQYFNRYISTFRIFAVLISISRYFSVRTLDFGSFFFPRFTGRKRSGTRFKPFPHTGSLSLSLHFSLCSSSILHGPLFAYFTPIRCRRLRVAT